MMAGEGPPKQNEDKRRVALDGDVLFLQAHRTNTWRKLMGEFGRVVAPDERIKRAEFENWSNSDGDRHSARIHHKSALCLALGRIDTELLLIVALASHRVCEGEWLVAVAGGQPRRFSVRSQ
jgi:hypothetical protein